MSWPERMAFSMLGMTVSSKPTMPGKRSAPARIRRTRLRRISVLISGTSYSALRSSPMVLGRFMISSWGTDRPPAGSGLTSNISPAD